MKFVASCMSMVALVAATSHTARSHTATSHIVPPLFSGSTESTWSVKQGTESIGRITLLTSPLGTRVEFFSTSTGAKTIFLGGNGTVWMRTGGQDAELSKISQMTAMSATSAALLLPFTTTKSDLLVMKDRKLSMYVFADAQATYVYDATGPAKVEVELRTSKYTLQRQEFGQHLHDASIFTIRPKQGEASRLAHLSGDLLGSSDTSVSATAGPSGAGNKGLTLKDGGDYAAVLALENRDGHWKADAKLDKALTDFQKTGKVGKARDEQ